MKDGYTPGTHLMKAIVPLTLLAGAIFFGAVEKDATGAMVCGTLAACSALNSDTHHRTEWMEIKDTYGLH